MHPLFRSLPFCFLLPACGTVTDWRELRTDPMTFGECYDGLAFVAGKDGFVGDVSASDRGLGTFQSRWRQRVTDDRHPGRFRLRAEVLIDEGSPADGWPIRFAIEQQRVKNLTRSFEPVEEDWSPAGQNREREVLFGEMLVRRLAPKRM